MKELPNYEMTVDTYFDFIKGKHVTGWVIDELIHFSMAGEISI